jgi:hypothetical protein
MIIVVDMATTRIVNVNYSWNSNTDKYRSVYQPTQYSNILVGDFCLNIGGNFLLLIEFS